MSKKITTTLEKICLQEKGSIISGPFGSNISSKFFVADGVPVIRGNNLSLSYDKFYDSGFVYVTKKKADELKCYAYKDDLIFTAAGTIGQVGVIPQDSKYMEYVISNKQIRARVDKTKVDLLYVYYWLSSPWIQNFLIKSNKGSTVPLLTLSEVQDLPITYPESLEEQKKIAQCIEVISRKIENNNRINDNLQQQLKLMYDYWFTQFDFPNEEGKPYRSSGGAMAWNEGLQRDIPVGWSCVTLGDLLEKNSVAFNYQTIEPTIDLSVMPSSSIALEQVNSSDMFSTNLFKMKEGDILFGSIRPYLKKAGIAPCNGVVAGTVHSYHVKRDSDYNFALFTLCRDAFFEYAVTMSTGTKMPVVSNDSILSYKIPYSQDVALLFNGIDVRHTICSNVQESQKLTALRDWLLPMLMNGQATIAD